MAFNAQSLARACSVPYAAGDVKSLHLYATGDALATVSASGYFNAATKSFWKKLPRPILTMTCAPKWATSL